VHGILCGTVTIETYIAVQLPFFWTVLGVLFGTLSVGFYSITVQPNFLFSFWTVLGVLFGTLSVGFYSMTAIPIYVVFNAMQDRGQKTEDCTVVNARLVSRVSCTL
jgi:uncharacterized membrane protein